MTKTYRDLLREARAAVREVSPGGRAGPPSAARAHRRARSERVGAGPHRGRPPHLQVATSSRTSRRRRPTATRPIVLYCAGGIRSLFAAQTLAGHGLRRRRLDERRLPGLEVRGPPVLDSRSSSRRSRSSATRRHLLIPEVGAEGQARLLELEGRCFIGAGGLGSPAMLYLAAAGVGTIGIVDFDVVDLSNLQRQVVHTTDRVGQKKTASAAQTIAALNPDVRVVAHEEMLADDNVERLIAGYDVILDGTDTFETRYTLNDAAVRAGIPVVHASVFRFEGQLTVFMPFEGPCYRCLYPTPPPPELAPGCSVAGVLGVVPGIMGLLQATEALKVLLGIGDPLVGPAAHLRRPRRHVLRAPAAPRPALPGLRRRCVRPQSADPQRGRLHAAHGHGRQRHDGRRAHDRGPDPAGAAGRRPATRSRSRSPGARSARRSTRSSRSSRPARPALTDDGSLNRFVNVYVNGRDVRYEQELATPVGEQRHGHPAAGHGRGPLTAEPAMSMHDRGCRSGDRARPVAVPARPRRQRRMAAASPRSSTPSASRRWSRSRSFCPNPNVRLYAKLEFMNPTGSVKDRVAKCAHRGPRARRPAAARTRSSSSRRAATPASRWR